MEVYTNFIKTKLEMVMTHGGSPQEKEKWLRAYIRLKSTYPQTHDISLSSLMMWQENSNNGGTIFELLTDIVIMTYFELNDDKMSIHSDSSVNNYIQ